MKNYREKEDQGGKSNTSFPQHAGALEGGGGESG